ncbi:MAG: DNA-binding protein [Dehalococcoidia bacterium]|nr:DNA-binding protein [Dehalococcoidia bacterium]
MNLPSFRDEPAEFSRRILEWGAGHGRDFPWRSIFDPYRVLIAEMMLRRTRADQVGPIYERFVDRFPDARALAAAWEVEVADLLRPLGLAWRVPAFRQMARMLVEEYGGTVPRDRRALISLPGVGEYVADAVLCVAFNEPVVLMDTNTVRVAGRYFGFPVHAESRRRVPVRRAVARLVDHTSPRASNLALLDFAAMVCRAGRPLCERCPVAAGCAWRQIELANSVEVSTVSAEAH